MEKIMSGYHSFRREVFAKQQKFFEHLAEKKQEPKALLITCSDSRIDPNLVTQTEPGDLFILRNAGNIIPPHGSANGGEGATIEYAVAVLKIQHIILCGHSHCGAMKALLEFNQSPRNKEHFPAVANWFAHTEATRRVTQERYQHLHGEELLNAIIEENILIQLNHLSTHPVVTTGLARGNLNLYGWRYEIESGTIYQYDQEHGSFDPMNHVLRPAVPLAIRRVGKAAERLALVSCNGKMI